MGLLKGNATFCRFRIAGEPAAPSPSSIGEQFRRFAFSDLFLDGEEKRTGWTGIEGPTGETTDENPYALGDFLLFRLRIDRKVVPPSLFRLHVREAERDERSRRQQPKLYREQREAIRERVRLDLLSRLPAVPAFHDAAWAASKRRVLFFSLADGIQEEIISLFRETFQQTLVPVTPWDPQVLDAIRGEKLAAIQRDAGAGEAAVLGRDFLTWLWFKSEERGGMVRLPPHGDIAVSLLRRIVLATGEGDLAETVTCQGLHADLGEGREALRRGKKIREARIRLGRDNAEWEFTFKADRFQYQSMSLPVAQDGEESGEDRDGRLLERLYLIERAAETMDGLFLMFLDARLSAGWEGERERMKKWLLPE